MAFYLAFQVSVDESLERTGGRFYLRVPSDIKFT